MVVIIFAVVACTISFSLKRTPRKCFRYVSEDHMIAKCPKPPKDNEKQQKQVSFNEKVNGAYNNVKNNDDHKIYASMA